MTQFLFVIPNKRSKIGEQSSRVVLVVAQVLDAEPQKQVVNVSEDNLEVDVAVGEVAGTPCVTVVDHDMMRVPLSSVSRCAITAPKLARERAGSRCAT
ncbi:MAG: hypothetical protein WKF73_03600 [Nocardioidaceae bacterium]